MSPSRSKTMRCPSGLTSTFIHVPSDVSNSIFCTGPRSAVTSHFLVSACCARGTASGIATMTRATRSRFIGLSFRVLSCLLDFHRAVGIARNCSTSLGTGISGSMFSEPLAALALGGYPWGNEIHEQDSDWDGAAHADPGVGAGSNQHGRTEAGSEPAVHDDTGRHVQPAMAHRIP